MKKIITYALIATLCWNNLSYAISDDGDHSPLSTSELDLYYYESSSDSELSPRSSDEFIDLENNEEQIIQDSIDKAVEEARPNRTSPWIRFNSQNKQIAYNEYYISGKDSACGFRAFGYDSRVQAVDTLIGALTNPAINPAKKNQIKEYIKNSIYTAEDGVLCAIFGADRPTSDSKEQFASNEQNQITYLNYFKTPGIELSFQIHFDDEGNPIENDRKYDLIDAFAVLKEVNLYIYRPQGADKKLRLAHFISFNAARKNLLLIYKDAHYNRLALCDVAADCNEALLDENSDLEILRNSLSQAGVSASTLDESLFTHTSEDPSISYEVLPALTLNISSENQSSSSAIDCASTFSSVRDQARSRREIQPVREARPLPAFTREQILHFVKNPASRLGALGCNDSCQAAYAFLKEKEDLESKCVLVRLALNHNFIPHGMSLRCFFNELLVSMQQSIKTANQERIRHYLNVYIGKIYIKLGEFDKAWRIFKGLSKKYTQTFLVDMVEMIIEHDFLPENMNQWEAYKYAMDILDDLYQSGNGKAPHSQRNGRAQKPTKNIEAPDYLTTRIVKQRVESLKRQRRVAIEQDAPVEEEDQGEAIERSCYSTFQVQRDLEASVLSERRERAAQSVLRNGRYDGGRDVRKRPRENIESDSDNDLMHHAKRSRTTEVSLIQRDDVATVLDSSDSSSADDVEIDFFDEENEQIKNRIRCLIIKGKCFGKQKNNKNSVNFYLKSLELLDKHDDVNLRVQTLIGLGNARYTDSDHQSNVDWYLEALQLLGESDDISLRAQALIGLGNARYADIGHRTDASWYKEALDVLGDSGDIKLRAQVLVSIGNARYEDRDHKRKDWYLKALQLLGRNGDVNLRAQALIGLGNMRYAGDVHQSDIGWYLDALKLLGERGDIALRAQALIGLGSARYTDDTHQSDAVWHQEALKLLGESGDINLRAQALIGLGNARYIDVGHQLNAAWYLEALKLLGESGDINLRVQALIGLGRARYKDDDHQFNADWYLEALELLGDCGDVGLRAQALIGLGNARYENREHKREYWYSEALQLLGRNGDINLRAQALIGLGNARYRGEQNKWYLEALKLLGGRGDVALQAQALIGLGNARYENRDHKRENFYREALHLLGESGDINLRSQAMIGLGNARYEDRDHKREHWYCKALRILGESGDINLRAQALIGLGNARYIDVDHQFNAAWYLEALDILGERGDIALGAQALIGLGNARYTDNKHQKNADWYLEALQLLGDRGDINLRAQALIGLGNARYENREHKREYWYHEALRLLKGSSNRALIQKAQEGLGRV
ncbi:MAG: hypothetical protein Q8L85_06490 [Alphaproteobacteria bacterium]|nr:hypothetical protein [Alphaproteobacteria bacterium]